MEPRAWMRMVLAAALVLGAFSLARPSRARSFAAAFDGKPEYEARAAFIILLSKYAQWPENPAQAPPGGFVIGVLGEDPFGPGLASQEGGTVHGQRVVIKRFRDVTKVTRCQVLYFPAAEEKQIAALRERLLEWNTLTIGESGSFVALGGAVRLYTDDGYMRFDINLSALEQVRVRLEAKVLRLARRVHQGS